LVVGSSKSKAELKNSSCSYWPNVYIIYNYKRNCSFTKIPPPHYYL